MEVIHHGGKDTVTGSCHEIPLDIGHLLVDCGLLQGGEATQSEQVVRFPSKHLIGIAITHAHIDHIGRLPWLIASGFNKPIYCTPATSKLIPLMLEDGLKLQLGLSALQRDKVLSFIKRLIRPIPFKQWYRLGAKTYLRFQPAGHILGSAYLEVKLPDNKIVVFSGDLGQYDTPLLPDPISPTRADYLYIETTYGDKNHDPAEQRAMRMAGIINHALTDGGTILIPAFSVGRTQELLFDIEQLIHQHNIDANIPIILDSPLAEKVTKTYRQFKKLWGKEAKTRLDAHRHPLAFDQCITVSDHKQHSRLVNRLKVSAEPAIVVAASGMCEGGRIVNYLKALLPDERNDVIFAGYQAKNTLGREIQSGAIEVDIDGEKIEINAQVHTMSGYSAHAGQDDLMRFIKGIEPPPEEIHLIQGEDDAKHAFATLLRTQQYRVIE